MDGDILDADIRILKSHGAHGIPLGALYRAGYRTVRQVVESSDTTLLMAVRGLGLKGRRGIRESIDRYIKSNMLLCICPTCGHPHKQVKPTLPPQQSEDWLCRLG